MLEDKKAADVFKKKNKSGDYLDYSVEYFRQNLKTMLLLPLIYHVPVTFILFYLIDYGNIANMFIEAALEEEPDLVFFKVLLIYFGLIIYGIYESTFVHAVSLGTIKHTYENIVNENVMTLKQSIIHGLKRFLWYFLYMVVAYMILGAIINVLYFMYAFILIVFALAGTAVAIVIIILSCLFFIAFSVAFIYLMLRTYFVPHAISVEKLDCFKAFKLSMQLTRGKIKYIILPILFCLLFAGAIPQAVKSVVYILPFDDPLVNRIVAAAAVAATGLFYPFKYVVSTQLYIYLKNEKGIMDFRNRLDNLVKDESPQITFGRSEEVVK